MLPEEVIYLASAILALALEYLPPFAGWYGQLSEGYKRLVMVGLIAGVVGGAFGLSCAGMLSVWVCSWAGAFAAVKVFLLAIGVNQGVHFISKRASG